MLLIVLLIGLGGLVYWQFGAEIEGFLASSGGTTPTADTKAPTFSNITHTAGTNSARIDWKTDEPASTQVEYGKTENYGSFAPAQPQNDPTAVGPDGKPVSAGVVTHSVVLTGLEPNTTYYYRVKSKDKAGNEAVSDRKSFKTTVPEA